MGQAQTTMVQTEAPVRLLTEMQVLVKAGWFQSLDELMVDALRRFVESHRGQLMEQFVREDVAWSLTGDE